MQQCSLQCLTTHLWRPRYARDSWKKVEVQSSKVLKGCQQRATDAPGGRGSCWWDPDGRRDPWGTRQKATHVNLWQRTWLPCILVLSLLAAELRCSILLCWAGSGDRQFKAVEYLGCSTAVTCCCYFFFFQKESREKKVESSEQYPCWSHTERRKLILLKTRK